MTADRKLSEDAREGDPSEWSSRALTRLRAENAALTAIADAATHWLDHWEDVHEDEDDCSFCLGARVGLNEALRDALAARPSTDTPAADDTETGT